MIIQDAIPRHPARYTEALLPTMARFLRGYSPILDPFAGVGGIFKLLAWLPDASIEAVEIEPLWAAADARITVGNALSLPWPDAYFSAIAVSPAYGNRMADHHNARDASKRNTYRHALGQQLQPDNSGALQWGPAYRALHERAWREAIRVLRPGGRFVLNCKDHPRRGKVQPVTQWHVETLGTLGLRVVERVQVTCPGNRFGANGSLRVEFEEVIALDKEN